MTAELGFLAPLFEIADKAQSTDQRGQTFVSLRGVDVGSSMARDDSKADLDRYRVSDVVRQSLTAALEHAVTLRDLVRRPTPRPADWPEPMVTSSAPFTLLRGVLEPASVALWVLSPTDRLERQKRAPRYWYDNYKHAGIWQNETRWDLAERDTMEAAHAN